MCSCFDEKVTCSRQLVKEVKIYEMAWMSVRFPGLKFCPSPPLYVIYLYIVRVCVCIYIYTHTHTHIYIYTHTHTHIYIYISFIMGVWESSCSCVKQHVLCVSDLGMQLNQGKFEYNGACG